MTCHVPRIFDIVQTPTMNPILSWSTESSSLFVNFLPEKYRKNNNNNDKK